MNEKPELRVIYADDEENIGTDFLKLQVARAFPGYSISMDRVYNGRSLVASVKEGDYKFIVTDHNMPELEGFEALLELQRRGIKIPSLIITGFGREEIEPRINLLERTIVLSKPFSFKEFTDAARLLAPEYTSKN